jgi:hypothetical protein
MGAVGASLPAGALLATQAQAANTLSKGDADILRFLAAAELIETDLWQQYAELGGAGNSNHPAYKLALENIDGDMPQYITDNTDDELSHGQFLNAYLKANGAQPVNLDKFRTLHGSDATGASKKPRLTNLKALNVDTSWYVRYRSGENPDLGANFGQALTIRNQPAIPLNDTDTPTNTVPANPPDPKNAKAERIQAIANTAAFHFTFIEQGGSSLYTAMAQKASSLEVLRIVVSIGGVEVDHFSLWHDKVGNTVSGSLAGVTDPETGLNFPDFSKRPNQELNQTNKILPEPAGFIREGLPDCSVIRPSSQQLAGAVAAARAFADDNLFKGQPQEFFDTLMALAKAADAAERRL